MAPDIITPAFDRGAAQAQQGRPADVHTQGVGHHGLVTAAIGKLEIGKAQGAIRLAHQPHAVLIPLTGERGCTPNSDTQAVGLAGTQDTPHRLGDKGGQEGQDGRLVGYPQGIVACYRHTIGAGIGDGGIVQAVGGVGGANNIGPVELPLAGVGVATAEDRVEEGGLSQIDGLVGDAGNLRGRSDRRDRMLPSHWPQAASHRLDVYGTIGAGLGEIAQLTFGILAHGP